MWIITDKGFISLVRDKHDKTKMQVRSRVREDIEKILPGVEVYAKDGADYRYRASVSTEEVAVAIGLAVLNIDYESHFKDVAILRSADPGARRTAYYDIWSALSRLQDWAPYAKGPRPKLTPKTTPRASRFGRSSTAMIHEPRYSSAYDDLSDDGLWSPPYDDRSMLEQLEEGWVDADGWAEDLGDTEDLGDAENARLLELLALAEQRFGKPVIDAMSADELAEVIGLLEQEEKETQEEKDRAFAADYTGYADQTRNRGKRGKRGKRGRRFFRR